MNQPPNMNASPENADAQRPRPSERPAAYARIPATATWITKVQPMARNSGITR